jgi:glycosidase
LRAYYQELLQLCRKEKAIREGRFYDLQPFHRGQQHYHDQVLSYLRFTGEECLLFIINFSVESHQSCTIIIPEHLLVLWGLVGEFQLKGIFGTTDRPIYAGQLQLSLPPLASFILRVK